MYLPNSIIDRVSWKWLPTFIEPEGSRPYSQKLVNFWTWLSWHAVNNNNRTNNNNKNNTILIWVAKPEFNLELIVPVAGLTSWDFFALMMESVSTTETSVYYKETTRRNISERCNLHDLAQFQRRKAL
jgi:hypothetical protein